MEAEDFIFTKIRDYDESFGEVKQSKRKQNQPKQIKKKPKQPSKQNKTKNKTQNPQANPTNIKLTLNQISQSKKKSQTNDNKNFFYCEVLILYSDWGMGKLNWNEKKMWCYA